jgi:hypothetical protein
VNPPTRRENARANCGREPHAVYGLNE